MKYWFGKQPESKYRIRTSFPAIRADLSEEVVADTPGLDQGLEGFAQQLAEQMGVPGITLHSILFTTRRIKPVRPD